MYGYSPLPCCTSHCRLFLVLPHLPMYFVPLLVAFMPPCSSVHFLPHLQDMPPLPCMTSLSLSSSLSSLGGGDSWIQDLGSLSLLPTHATFPCCASFPYFPNLHHHMCLVPLPPFCAFLHTALQPCCPCLWQHPTLPTHLPAPVCLCLALPVV